MRVATRLAMDATVHQGVYAMIGGPNYETVAELRMLRMLGADRNHNINIFFIWLVQ